MYKTYYITTQPTRFGLTVKVRTSNETLNNTEKVFKKCSYYQNKDQLAELLKNSVEQTLRHLDEVGTFFK